MMDARGLSCPEPVIMIKKAMASGENSYEMAVDNRTSLENVIRFAQHSGYQVEYTRTDGEYAMCIHR